MTSDPFDMLDKPKVDHYDEWSGTFACQTTGCSGWANIARYINKQRLLIWKCQDGHKSYIEDMDE